MKPGARDPYTFLSPLFYVRILWVNKTTTTTSTPTAAAAAAAVAATTTTTTTTVFNALCTRGAFLQVTYFLFLSVVCFVLVQKFIRDLIRHELTRKEVQCR